jgi:hypothetical protein
LENLVAARLHAHVDAVQAGLADPLEVFHLPPRQGVRACISCDAVGARETFAYRLDNFYQIIRAGQQWIGVLEKHRPDRIAVEFLHLVQIGYHLFGGAQGEFRALVHRAEGATVPGAISRHPDQQAAGFRRWTYRALFEIRHVL